MPNPLALLFPLTAPPSVRYPCSLHFKDEEIDSERGSDWPKVTQLVSRIELQAVLILHLLLVPLHHRLLLDGGSKKDLLDQLGDQSLIP